jgi:hypothetical protein
MFLISCTYQNSQNSKMFIIMFKILLVKTSKTVKCKFTLYGSREMSRDQKEFINIKVLAELMTKYLIDSMF